MLSIDWTELLREPMAIRGPYGNDAPSLATFAPYAWRAQFDQVAIAGQFMQLPAEIPPSWGPLGRARADVVLEFSEVRLLRVEGLLGLSKEDDSLHGQPGGMPGECSLTVMPEWFLEDVEKSIALPWKQFKFVQGSFSMLLEAGDVAIHCGRRASVQFGHRDPI